VLTSPNDYATALDALKNGGNTLDFRRGLMQKAFEHTAAYDAMIANYMNMRIDNNFGATHFIAAHKVCATSYGENPHQRGALYETGAFWGNIATLKGAPSFNNYADLNQALKIATNFGARPAVAIVKHGNPCGFALRDTLAESYKAALACDPISAYGGVAAINGILDEPLARLMNEHYLEVIIAAQITQEAQDIFAAKKRIKLFATNSDALQIPHDSINFKHIEGGFLLQQADRVSEAEIANMQCKSARTASERELEDLAIAYKIAALTKSNCIVYVKDRAMVAIGMGMTSRVDAALAALRKADELKIDMHGAVCASEAFFPFRDSIDSAARAGITAVIEPGGSIRDKEVIEAANEHKIALYFTGTRHFYH
ncbi:MAG: bifunctional phosphoribosylaminoimidazolecarboxamide formyltransferase/IMP cyclohydrolase, partial [Helicobacter sp.]|nr:bifunctional phosphoribosylaminoimidazolecarboxamide formyltransferase/IMP cyclohydrolase [Helicobacter sp.]